MIRRPPRSTLSSSSAASDVYKRQHAPSTARGDIVVVSVVRPDDTRDRWTADPIVRMPEGAVLPPQLAAGPVVSVWATWAGCGRPLIADPIERLRDAHRAWASAGQAWSMAQG